MIAALESRLQKLEQGRVYFEKLLKQSNASQLGFAPHPRHWNILQVVDHIIKVERQTLNFLQNFDFSRKDEKVGMKNRIKFFLLKLSLKSNLKFKVPTKEVIPEVKGVSELLQEWEKLRNDLNDFLEGYPIEKLQNFIFFHPKSGKLNIFQTLEFLQDHMKHHRQQVRRISNYADFPTL